jgi:hypothetical protein
VPVLAEAVEVEFSLGEEEFDRREVRSAFGQEPGSVVFAAQLHADAQLETVGAIVEPDAGVRDRGERVIADGIVQAQASAQFGARAIEEGGPLSAVAERADEREAVDLGSACRGAGLGARGTAGSVGVEDIAFGDDLEGGEIRRARAGVILGGDGEAGDGAGEDGGVYEARETNGGSRSESLQMR